MALPPHIQARMLRDPRYQLAQALQGQALGQRNIQHPMQGLAQLAQALVAKNKMNAVQQDYDVRGRQYNNALANALTAASGRATPWTNPDTGQVTPAQTDPFASLAQSGDPQLMGMALEGRMSERAREQQAAAELAAEQRALEQQKELLGIKDQQERERLRLAAELKGQSGGSVWQQKADAITRDLVSEGMEPRRAQIVGSGIATGRFRESRDPISGQVQIVDAATGRPVSASFGTQGQPAVERQTATPRADESVVPPGADFSGATGTSGFVKGAANTLAGAVEAPAPFPEVEDAEQALNNLQIRTQTAMQAAVPGRPSNYLMEQLGRLSVSPGNIMQGDDRALTRLRQTRSMLEGEIDRLQRDILGNSGDFRPSEISAARANLSQLQSLKRQYDQVVERFGQSPIGDIGNMSMEALQAVDPSTLSEEQLRAAERRFEELGGM